MKAIRRYRISITDESRLRQVASVSARPYMLIIGGVLVALLLLILAAVLIMITPLRTLMPGYLKEGERTAAEKGILRLDSLREAYDRNTLYLSNIITVLDTDRTPSDSTLKTMVPNELPPDSLLPASPKEIEFLSRLKDREKYNVTMLAPLTADQMRFYQPAAGARVASHSEEAVKAQILTPKESPVTAIADGRVISVQNPAPEGGVAMVIHHDKGFVSRYSHIGIPAVAKGSYVEGGSVIAHGATGGATAPGWFFLEMWYDGASIVPAKYIMTRSARGSIDNKN